MRHLFFLLIFFILQPVASAQTGWQKTFDHGAVSSADQLASEVGKQILMQGGNAVDAAIAVQFALAVTLPRAGNIGGGGFMVVRLADGTVNTLDFREKAPLSASRDMYIKEGEYQSRLSKDGALAVGVPGTVDGMVQAHQKYGTMEWKSLIEPAIKLAENGYSLSYSQAAGLNAHLDRFRNYTGASVYFLPKNDSLFSEGDLFVQKDLAQTLTFIADLGRDGFYAGEVADEIVNEMNNLGGIITHEDLNKYESVWRAPVTVDFRGYKLYLMPPPSSGSVAIAQILKMMEPYPLEEMGFGSADYLHVMAESMRRAFADRSFYLGEPDFWEVPISELTSVEYNSERMNSFSMDSVTPSETLSHGDVPGYQESTETTHFSIIDRDGNAVGITTTLNGSFGSHVAVTGAGFLLNNEMDDFSAQPGVPNMFGLLGGEANSIQPEKRMLSSMIPMIATKDGKVVMVIGAAGGPRIITAVLQNFLNMAVFEMDAQQANAAPRIHHQWMPDILFYDRLTLSPDTIRLLEAKGHKLRPSSVARIHSLMITEDGKIGAGVDPRGDGYAAGF